MTAEIGVLNRLAVALAADSAVTLGGPSGKVYASSDKLFQLSDVAPVGIMVYGNADFLGRPWETIIKDHRRALGATTYPTLAEYAQHFFAHLNASKRMLPPEAEDRALKNLVVGLFLDIRGEMEQALDEASEKADGLDEGQITSVCSTVLSDRLKVILGRAPLEKEHDGQIQEVLAQYTQTIAEAKEGVFGKLPLSPESEAILIQCALETLTRDYFGGAKSGLVFAGFGEDEYFPSLAHFECEGMLLGKIRLRDNGLAQITESNSATIIPFAQREAVTTFLEGMDAGLAGFVRASTSRLFFGAFDVALTMLHERNSALAAELNDRLRPELKKMLAKLMAEWKEKRRSLWSPVVDIVAALPKDELAAMAEALVNLTKFRRRVTPERETVGGPIDVALISKGDGFIWVKRKHYFDPQLNPRAVARYSNLGEPHV
ncbi:MAG: hypothetical protein HOP28_09195 [Gemmatimonadales bacterium]|nr:hypothetical protein [Gemmatimonadales bacterium]